MSHRRSISFPWRFWTIEPVSDAVTSDVAGRSTGATIADLERVIQLAARTAAKGDGGISDEILLEAFELLLFGDARVSLNGKTLLRVARHEAGHCVVAWWNGMDEKKQIRSPSTLKPAWMGHPLFW